MLNKCLNEFRGKDDGKWVSQAGFLEEVGFSLGLKR